MNTRYIIVYEKMGGSWYYMVYKRLKLAGWMFVERCNTPETAICRVDELNEA